jgi:hypothetical protein
VLAHQRLATTLRAADGEDRDEQQRHAEDHASLNGAPSSDVPVLRRRYFFSPRGGAFAVRAS